MVAWNPVGMAGYFHGYVHTIEAADMDGDGSIDLIVGNESGEIVILQNKILQKNR